MGFTSGQVGWRDIRRGSAPFSLTQLELAVWVSPGTVPRQVASPNAHTLAADDVVSCCLDLSVPSISFRINGHPVQGMFENFNVDGLFFPVLSFSAGVKQVSL